MAFLKLLMKRKSLMPPPLGPGIDGSTPWGIEGQIVCSLCPFPDESADVHQMLGQSVQPFGRFPDF